MLRGGWWEGGGGGGGVLEDMRVVVLVGFLVFFWIYEGWEGGLEYF